MLIPLGTDRPRRRPTRVTYWLMGLCIFIYMLQVLVQGGVLPGLEMHDACVLFRPVGEGGRWSLASGWWQFLTYQFMHGSTMHLLGNMLFLFVFGPPVEDRFGRWGFGLFYLLGGVVAGFGHWLTAGATPVLGASGSISGVTGAFLVLFPLVHVRVLLFFILIGIFSIPAWWFIAFAVMRDMFGLAAGANPVAYGAHLGGYAYGALVSTGLLWASVISREPYDLFSLGRQAHRRSRYKDLASKGGGAFRTDDANRRRVMQAKRERDQKRDAERSERRAKVIRALSGGDVSGALRLYRAALDEDADAVLGRDAQHSLGIHAYERGDYTAASVIFELFIKKYPRDREADEVRLLLALINARYLNDPVRAKKLLAELKKSGLSEDHQVLAGALRDELG
ncbi:MAG: rhomboid family intramembrane serine protease [Phycisphaeraceae bacterium]|nr:MAG: rhomboid family intramembrane serine protease [Phycisphaeraceae bacterium]